MDSQRLYSWIKRQNTMDIGVLQGDEHEEARRLLGRLQAVEGPISTTASSHAAESVPEEEPMQHEEVPRLDDARALVHRNLPPAISVFSGKQSLIRDGLYTYLDYHGNTRKAKRNSPSKKYMLPILDNLRRLDVLLGQNFDPLQRDNIEKCFHDICLSCENYLENRNPWTSEGKARKQMIRDFYDKVRYESIGFSAKIDDITNDTSRDYSGTTWLDLLSETRVKQYENGVDGVSIEIGGAGTSKVYIVEKNGVKKYFKESEKIPPEDFDTLMDMEVRAVSSDRDAFLAGNHTQAEKDSCSEKAARRTRYLEVCRKAISEVFPNIDSYINAVQENSEEGDLIPYLISVMRGQTAAQDAFLNMTAALDAEKDALDNELAYWNGVKQRASDQDEEESADARIKQTKAKIKECDYTFIESTLIQIKKNSVLHYIAINGAQIDPSSEVSKRNVATSRMAALLGISNIVAGSSIADVIIDGKKMRGIMMDEAPGVAAASLVDTMVSGHQRVAYTSASFRQLLNLQIFDMICGQVDRHMNNYLCQSAAYPQYRTTELLSVMGIDNDLSFGTLTYSDITDNFDNGIGHLHSFEVNGEIQVPCADYDLAIRIRNLTEEIVNYEMCDILSKEERKALWDRIKGVKKHLDKQFAREEKIRTRQDFKSFFIGHPSGSHTWDEHFQAYQQRVRQSRAKDEHDATEKENELLYDDSMTDAEKERFVEEIRHRTDNDLLYFSYFYGPLF